MSKFVVTNTSFQQLGLVVELDSTCKVEEEKVFYQYYDEAWGETKSIEVGVTEVSDQLLKEWLKKEVVGYEEAIAILVALGEEEFFAKGRVDYTLAEIEFPWMH